MALRSPSVSSAAAANGSLVGSAAASAGESAHLGGSPKSTTSSPNGSSPSVAKVRFGGVRSPAPPPASSARLSRTAQSTAEQVRSSQRKGA
eukprot:9482609-Pyramimonas_sp.AAC.1